MLLRVQGDSFKPYPPSDMLSDVDHWNAQAWKLWRGKQQRTKKLINPKPTEGSREKVESARSELPAAGQLQESRTTERNSRIKERRAHIYKYINVYIYICRGQEQTRQKEKQEATVCCCFFTHPCHPGSSCLCCRPTVMRNMQCTPDEQAYSIINQGVLLASEQDQPSRQRKNVDEGCQSDLALHQRQ